MGKVSYIVDLEAPVEKCFANLKRCHTDERFKKACSDLISPKYIPEIVEEIENKKIRIKEFCFEPITGVVFRSISIILNYSLEPIAENKTRINITIDYSLFASIMACGMLKGILKDKLIWIVSALISSEYGITNVSEH